MPLRLSSRSGLRITGFKMDAVLTDTDFRPPSGFIHGSSPPVPEGWTNSVARQLQGGMKSPLSRHFTALVGSKNADTQVIGQSALRAVSVCR